MNKLEVMNRVLHDIKDMDIKDIISKYINVQRIGTSFTALCPFHNDNKIGNFMIDSGKNIFKCFACGQGGDAITFVSEYLGIGFSETIALLGQDYGLLSIDEYEKYFSYSKKVGVRKTKYVPKPKPKTQELVDKLDDTSLNILYTLFLSKLELSDSHRKHLKEIRNLDDESIKNGNYKSLTKELCREKIMNSMLEDLKDLGYSDDALIGVPGFYKENGCWKMDWVSGLVIPIKNYKGEITGIQIRRDHNDSPRYVWFSSAFAKDIEKGHKYGCSPKQPLDVIYPNNKVVRKQLIITEGRFKSEILANKWGFITISVQGITNWKGISDAIRAIEDKIGFEFNTIFTAFDADMSFNYQVFEQLKKMTDSINGCFDCNKEIIYLHWDHNKGKGIDDLIINSKEIKSEGLIKKYKKEVVDNKYEEEYNKVIELRTNMKEQEIKNIAIQETFAS